MPMKSFKWYFHPIFIFTFSLVALITSLFLYIRSYLQVSDSVRLFVEKNKVDASQFLATDTWVTILITSILVAIILAGTIIIFVYYQKIIQLYRMQQNFINGFTHELKTPVASIRLFLDTFKKHELSREDQLKYIDFMIRDADRLADNVGQILNLGKIEDRSFNMNNSRVELFELASEFLEKNPHLFESIEINIKKIDHVEYFSFIDTALMEMVFMNIITNAIRYNDSNRPQLNIEFNSLGKKMSISFIDNGMGIKKSEQRNVFKKFYQVGKSTKGSGLGLYLSSQILKLQKGSIEVESRGEGQGSTFTIILPREIES
ncbi:putative sensor kinase protein [Halobacteriovorax marinus SJ]|uniref:histidine kinase n=1 Tax=Halobacteriovorax marinus (strain ATCC BAA-682 / DSM 15412 / SJ) TaxID=862908 RepID=E1X339_HALMS|nr:putative sensor kinase protein [Halobacteriovorax marinus SJ]